MPRRKVVQVFKYAELDPDVREKVLDRFRESAFDQDSLTDQFKSILEERGLDPDVCWSLGYSQGDGVAFSGNLDLPTFFKWALEGDDPKYREAMEASGVSKFLPLRTHCSVKVHKSGRYCHWNSMDIELDLTSNFVDLIPESIRGEAMEYLEENSAAIERYERDLRLSIEARYRPIMTWERKNREREELMQRGPKEWKPPVGPRPREADVPAPAKNFPIPSSYVREFIAKAEEDWKSIDAMSGEFRKFLEDWVKNVSRELEKLGYAEIEYQQSEEQIVEMIDANEYEFYEDGRIAR